MTAVPGGTAGGAAVAAMIRAVRASGVLVRVEEREFRKVLEGQEEPVVVTAPAGFLGRKRAWLTTWRGLAFHCVTAGEIPLPGAAVVVAARRIWVP